jgi:hypothetical protein
MHQSLIIVISCQVHSPNEWFTDCMIHTESFPCTVFVACARASVTFQGINPLKRTGGRGFFPPAPVSNSFYKWLYLLHFIVFCPPHMMWIGGKKPLTGGQPVWVPSVAYELMDHENVPRTGCPPVRFRGFIPWKVPNTVRGKLSVWIIQSVNHSFREWTWYDHNGNDSSGLCGGQYHHFSCVCGPALVQQRALSWNIVSIYKTGHRIRHK